MVGFYQSILVIALGAWGSAADSLFNINIDVSQAERLCEAHNTTVRKEWLVALFSFRSN